MTIIINSNFNTEDPEVNPGRLFYENCALQESLFFNLMELFSLPGVLTIMDGNAAEEKKPSAQRGVNAEITMPNRRFQMGKNTLWSLAFATLTGVCALLPSTSAQEPPQQPRDIQAHVSDQQLEAFAKAYVEHDTIRQTYEPLHKNAPDSEARTRIEQEANAKAEEALAKQGLTSETYKQIFSTVNANGELRKRALKLIDENRRRS